MTAIETLAAEGQASLFLIFAGVVLVILLIGAFWYGSRRRRREAPPAELNPVAQRREYSWQAPEEHARDQKDQVATKGPRRGPVGEATLAGSRHRPRPPWQDLSSAACG
ncbi:DUF6479 family protein [Streptomyces sp. NPDC055796]